jgi:NADPH-dependent 2,4-dienoyl-CoA reductase/sulfur reductase-like enzyme
MREGREDRIRLCGACLQGCLALVKAGRGLGCIVNPEVGREGEKLEPARSRKAILIVGGGPAGLTAAITARRRGYENVRLLEARPELGGQFALSFLSPGKEAIERPFRSLIREALDSGAEILTGHEADAAEIAAWPPDEVILATGARPIAPRIDGLDDPATGEEILAGVREAGPRVLVLGGGLVGIEVAEWLARRGRDVTVVEALEDIARDMEPVTRKLTLKRLEGQSVTIVTSTVLERMVGGHAVVVTDGEERTLGKFDTVVVAVGVRPRDSLKADLEKKGIEVHVVGDADRPGQVVDAVQAAYELVAGL